MNSFTEENYLKALLALSGDSGEVSVNELSKKMGIKMPTVTSMMKSLARKKLVHYERYKPLRLTSSGKKTASLILRKHRLIEIFLAEKMGFGWEEVHNIAEQIEHIDAPELFERIDEMLGYPKIDPHGQPIPDKDGKLKLTSYRKLSTCKLGDTVMLRAVPDTSIEFLKFLNSRELYLGLKIIIKSIEPVDGSMLISYGKRRNEMISHTICERLLVE
jgi:DtxR family Mn-dependent transcriptional regulator